MFKIFIASVLLMGPDEKPSSPLNLDKSIEGILRSFADKLDLLAARKAARIANAPAPKPKHCAHIKRSRVEIAREVVVHV